MTFVVDVFNNWWLWQQMARLESDISWMWKNKTGFSGRMLQEVINLSIETKNQNFHFLIMISRARSAWRGGQGVWLPGPATHSETRGNHRWGRSELWVIFATSSKVSKLEDGCRSHRQTSNVTGPRGSQGVEVMFEFSWQHKTPPSTGVCHQYLSTIHSNLIDKIYY